MNPLVSIITPSFNAQKYIAQTIQSVQNQTYKYWELIIVDDGSTDDTVSIINNFILNDHRIFLKKISKNSGAGVARNIGLQIATGNFITFLDADDLWKPEKLEKQLHFMQEQNIPFTFSFYETIDENGNLLNKTITTPLKITYKQLYYCNWIGNLTAIYNLDVLGKISISPLKKRQDWILWLQILKQIKSATPVNESLAYYRVRTNSLSSSKWKLIKYNFNVYKNYHQRNIFWSTLDTFRFLYVQFFIKPKYKITTKK